MSSTVHPAPAAPSPTAVASRSRILHVGSIGMIMGGLVVVVGSVLPWVMTPLGSVPGTAGPGLWTLCAGFVAIAGALLPYRRLALGHALVSGVAVAAIAGWQVARLGQLSAATDAWGQLMPGMGLVMAAGGAVILLRAARRIWSA